MSSTSNATPEVGSLPQQQKRVGLLVTSELEKALAECNALVERISKDCRAKNLRFSHFLHNVKVADPRPSCLFGLSKENRNFSPSDVQRVTKIFRNPLFFANGAGSNDIVQGQLGDCYFLSALSTMTTAKGLVEKFCVARDEQVGVYGWIFFRDTRWVTVIIDDLLFMSIPKFEELTTDEKVLYHQDKSFYNSSARKGGKSLYFSHSGTEGETWVPLIEKAYAKLHGDYASLVGGCGVSTFINTKDILDPDVFWKNELLLATKDRLFGCSFESLDGSSGGYGGPAVNGLIGGHAYSVLRAVEYRDRRFVVLRDPWGKSGWTGPWSDGSKEWTEEWLPALKALKHGFGDAGEFVMEYSDFLDSWEDVERTLLFDDSWVMSSQWMQFTARPAYAAWSYGDISFTISIPALTKAVIVLSKLDDRYFLGIFGGWSWMFDFVVFKKGSKELVAQSHVTRFNVRSVNVEVTLEQGEYIVHVRIDREINNQYPINKSGTWDLRKLARVRAERAKSMSIASNYMPRFEFAGLNTLPVPLDVLAGQDLKVVEAKAVETEKQLQAAEAALKKANSDAEAKAASPDQTVPKVEEVSDAADDKGEKKVAKNCQHEAKPKALVVTPHVQVAGEEGNESNTDGDGNGDANVDADNAPSSIAAKDLVNKDAPAEVGGNNADSEKKQENYFDEYTSDTVVLGLRVYTHRDAPAVISGQLREKMVRPMAYASAAL
ncbi:hypothetical protein GGX14DRAFT_451547 [Mycena pura]|uniref:Calpain catalytic domain-containing protein n=1 Tax=Mycena pura TaxID=153505 RepID=A0AAD6VFW5_9AGAR|nr:hypothetical protein GGX14DRAFT_451547 [Mycena pura]